MIPLVELYSTDQCALCAEAQKMLHELRTKIPFELREVKLTADHPQYDKYLVSVPVILVNGKHELTAPIDRKHVARLLRKEMPRDLAYSAGKVLKWIGLFMAVVGLAFRLFGEPELGYLIFVGAIVVFSIGWILARYRSIRVSSFGLNDRPGSEKR